MGHYCAECHLTITHGQLRLLGVREVFRLRDVMKQYTLVVNLSIVPLTVLVSLIIEGEKTGRNGAA